MLRPNTWAFPLGSLWFQDDLREGIESVTALQVRLKEAPVEAERAEANLQMARAAAEEQQNSMAWRLQHAREALDSVRRTSLPPLPVTPGAVCLIPDLLSMPQLGPVSLASFLYASCQGVFHSKDCFQYDMFQPLCSGAVGLSGRGRVRSQGRGRLCTLRRGCC